MGAGGSIPADEAAAKEAGRTDDEIALYKFCVGLQDGSTKDVSAEGCEFGPPGAPPLPIDAMLGICKNMVGALPDWKSLCLGIEKNEDGTYTVLTQQVCGAMKADLPAVEGTPFPEVKVAEIPEEAKIEMTLPVEVGTYTMEDGKVKKGLYVGEIRDGVEGAAEPTPAFVEMWKAGPETQGFAGFSNRPPPRRPPPRGSMVTIKPPLRTPPKKNRMDNTQSSLGSIGSASSSLMDLTSRGAKADEAGVAQAAMAADAERQEVEERERALSGDLGQDESDGEDVNFVVEHPPLAFDTNANMICTFTSEIFCECSIERLRSHETVVRICDDHPLALHSPDTDITFENGVPCEAFRKLLTGKKITRAAITLGKHSARWIHIEPPAKAEMHFAHARRPLGAANFEDGSTFVDYGFPSAGPCRYFPAAHESADRLLELGLRPPSKGGAGWTAPLVQEGLRCCGRACCNGKYREPPDLGADDGRGPELSYLTPREGCCAVS